jgi:hypothetical protein
MLRRIADALYAATTPIGIKMMLTVVLMCALLGAARGQTPVTGAPVQGVAQYRQTVHAAAKITTGLTYQLLLQALAGTTTVRQSITIQNNQASGTDVCYLIFGSDVTIVAGTTTTSSTSIVAGSSALTAAQASIVLTPGQAWTRYFPYIPSDAIYGTCATTGDSIYVDTQ